jgi:hypothetical protein
LYYAPEKSLPHLFDLIRYLKASILGEGEEKPYAIEHIDEIFSPIANLIKKYPDQTLSNIQGFLEIGFALIKDKDQEAVNGCKILIALLENYKSRLDQYIVQIITELSSAFTSCPSRKVKLACSQALFVALWNSPLVTLTAGPLISPAFQYALASTKFFSESLARNHIIYGLGSLFYIIPNLPPAMQETLPVIFKSIIQLCQDVDDDSSIEGEEFDDTNKEPVSVDAQCQKIIEKIRASTNDEDKDEDSFPFGSEAEDLYDSPFEVFNQNQMIKEVYNILKENYPEVYQKANSLLSEQETKLLKSLIL